MRLGSIFTSVLALLAFSPFVVAQQSDSEMDGMSSPGQDWSNEQISLQCNPVGVPGKECYLVPKCSKSVQAGYTDPETQMAHQQSFIGCEVPPAAPGSVTFVVGNAQRKFIKAVKTHQESTGLAPSTVLQDTSFLSRLLFQVVQEDVPLLDRKEDREAAAYKIATTLSPFFSRAQDATFNSDAEVSLRLFPVASFSSPAM